MAKAILAVLSLMISMQTYALNFNCVARHDGKKIEVKTRVAQGSNLNTTSGVVIIDGSETARFDAGQISISIIRKTFRGRNGQGDILDGKVLDLDTKKTIIRKLVSPGHGINYSNIPLACR